MEKTNTDKGNQKVICYLRTSTDKQEVESQKAELYEMIKADRYTEAQVIEVGRAGISACELKEEYYALYDEMERYIQTQNIACVYVHNIARLVRMDESRLTEFINKVLIPNRVQLIIKVGGLKLLNADGTVSDGMEMAIKLTAILEKQHTQQLKANTMRGRARNKAAGKFNGGVLPLGYRLGDNGKIDKDPEGAAQVVDLFTMYASGEWSYSVCSNAKVYQIII